MPPKPKFTKEEIVQAALEIVSQKGVEALTAKELGEALGTSARPIFTVFAGMKEVQDEVRSAAMRRFEGFAKQKLPDMPLFRGKALANAVNRISGYDAAYEIRKG